MIQKYQKNFVFSFGIDLLLILLGLYLNNTFNNTFGRFSVTIGWFLVIISSILFICDYCMYAMAKGYKWYIGLVASAFSLLGLLILILLPDKYKQEKLPEEDKISSSEQNKESSSLNK